MLISYRSDNSVLAGHLYRGQWVTRSAVAIRASLARISVAFAAIGLAGCTTVGPDFVLPEDRWAEEWRSETLDRLPSDAPLAQWWEQFDDPALAALITAAEAGNNNAKIAGLRVLEARAQLSGAQALRLPQLVVGSAGAGYGAAARGPLAIGDADFLFGNVGVQAGWELDLWGRFRRAIEGAEALWLESEATRLDVLIIVRAETARLYLLHRTLEERIAVIRSNADLQRRNVEITGTLFRRGAASELDLQQARAQLLTTEAAIPVLEAALLQTRNALCVVLGRPPGDVHELELSPPRLPSVPQALATDLPADLLRRRPDVRAAAYRAAAQSSRIGFTKADLFPTLSFGGSFALTRTSPSLGNGIDIGIGPAIRWNILDLGRIRADVRVQDARFEQALVAYRETVLRAAAEVDNSAIAFAKDREEDAVLTESLAAARRALDLANLLYREGMIDFQRVLEAQSTLLRQQERQVANRGEIAISLVQLYKALGGGWVMPADNELIDEETRERMRARTNWGRLLDPPQETSDD